jgi:hypothetical protein
MNDDDELHPATRKFLTELGPNDVEILRLTMPILRAAAGFGKVSKWLAITAAGLLLGSVMLWDAVLKIMMWFRGH